MQIPIPKEGSLFSSFTEDKYKVEVYVAFAKDGTLRWPVKFFEEGNLKIEAEISTDHGIIFDYKILYQLEEKVTNILEAIKSGVII